MQAHVFGNRRLISSVFAEMTPVGLQLGINITERQASYHRVGGCSEFSAQYDGVAPVHQGIEIYSGDDSLADDDDQRATVVFFAETPDEAKALRGIVYDCYDKGQLLLMLISLENLKTTASLVDLRLS